MATKKATAKKPTRKAPAKKAPAAKKVVKVSEEDAKTLESARNRADAKVTQLGQLRLQIMALEDQERAMRDALFKANQHSTAMVETVAMKYKINLATETWEFVWGDNVFRRKD